MLKFVWVPIIILGYLYVWSFTDLPYMLNSPSIIPPEAEKNMIERFNDCLEQNSVEYCCDLIGGNFAGGECFYSTEAFLEKISVENTVSVSVTRPYYWGAVRLPVYFASVGNIGYVHDIFLYWLPIALFIVFVWLEIRQRYEWYEEEKYDRIRS